MCVYEQLICHQRSSLVDEILCLRTLEGIVAAQLTMMERLTTAAEDEALLADVDRLLERIQSAADEPQHSHHYQHEHEHEHQHAKLWRLKFALIYRLTRKRVMHAVIASLQRERREIETIGAPQSSEGGSASSSSSLSPSPPVDEIR